MTFSDKPINGFGRSLDLSTSVSADIWTFKMVDFDGNMKISIEYRACKTKREFIGDNRMARQVRMTRGV